MDEGVLCLFVLASVQSLIVVALLDLVLQLAHLLGTQHVLEGFPVTGVTLEEVEQKICAFLFDFGGFVGAFVEGEDKGIVEGRRVAIRRLADLHPMHD